MNLIKLIGILAIVAGICFMFWGLVALVLEVFFRYLLEMTLWVASIGLVIGTHFASVDYAPWLLGVGSLLLPVAMFFSARMHNITIDRTKSSFALALLWGAIAMFYQSSFVGFFSVGALLTFLGFSFVVEPLCYSFGFKDDDAVWRGTVAGFFISVAYVATRAFNLDLGPAVVFESGALWLATFVCFLGVLIVSNEVYLGEWKGGESRYLSMNILAVLTLFAFASAGAFFGIREVTTMAGTFMILFFAGKILEVETESFVAFGFKLVVVGGVIFGAWELIRRNEAFFKPYLMM
jgi:hypothetical protein